MIKPITYLGFCALGAFNNPLCFTRTWYCKYTGKYVTEYYYAGGAHDEQI